MTELLSVKEAAQEYKLSPYTWRAWIYSGKIGVVRLGRRTLLRRADIEALIAKSLVPAKQPKRVEP